MASRLFSNSPLPCSSCLYILVNSRALSRSVFRRLIKTNSDCVADKSFAFNGKDVLLVWACVILMASVGAGDSILFKMSEEDDPEKLSL